MDRVSTGLKELDSQLEGGFPAGSCVLLSGDAGSGKTLLALNALVSLASAGKKVAYISMNESAEGLYKACEGIDSLKKARSLKGLAIEHVDLVEMVDLEYFNRIFRGYKNVDAVVIDNVNKLLLFARDSHEYRTNLAELVRTLKQSVPLSMLLCESMDGGVDTGNGESYEADGVVFLEFVQVEERPRRVLSVRKMRWTSFAERVPQELSISKKGLSLTKTKIV
jgi:KaiC/GvpD/RAD55 family RecA-like ATPase